MTLRKLQADQIGVSFFYMPMMVSFTTVFFLGAEIYHTDSTFKIPDLQSLLALAAIYLGMAGQSASDSKVLSSEDP